MINAVFFVSESTLKNNTALNDNIDSQELRFAIITAQNLNIQETLGQPLYEKIQSLISTNTIAGDYKYLLDQYIVPTTIYWAYYHALDNFFVKIMNVGIVANSTEQGNAIDFKTFQFLKNNAKSNAEYYDQAMRRYLCAYASLFPEYNTTPIGEILPQRGSAFRNSVALKPERPWPSWYGPVRVQTQP